MLQELHRAVPHGSSKYSRERAGVPVQEGPLPPEGAPRGSTHSVASWLSQPGKLFVLAALARGHYCISSQLVTITHIQGQSQGPCLGVRNKATRAGSIQEWLVLSASPEEAPWLLPGFPPHPQASKKKELEEIKAEIKVACPSSGKE